MASKTDRILANLPPTFQALPRPTALFAVADAAGEQLLQAESALGAVMLSHWVDHADRGAEFITDLGCFAALYGLAPRGAVKDVARFQMPTCAPVSADETVEEFREHLKRYVRTFLDGTVSVQGILRIVAEALGLHIADSYTEMDAWWTPGNEPLVCTEFFDQNAANLLFGKSATLEARGAAATPARVSAPEPFPPTINLDFPAELRVGVDGAAPVTVDLHLGKQATLRDVISRINEAVPAAIATSSGGRLSLASRTAGAKSRLVFPDSRNDLGSLLGLVPNTAWGTPATAADVTGVVPLVGELDLRRRRFLRLTIDNQTVEVDCGGTSPAHRSLADIVAAINGAFEKNVASAQGQFLKLRSTTRGSASRIEFHSPAAQDTREFLFGEVDTVSVGEEAAAATFFGSEVTLDNDTFDLSEISTFRLALDNSPPVDIDCAGSTPSATTAEEIIDNINWAFAGKAATVGTDPASEEEALVIRSTTVGPDSRLRFVTGDKPDAARPLFGVEPRSFTGADAASARLVGAADLSHGIDLRTMRRLAVGIDNAAPVEIDLLAAARDAKAVHLHELVTAINSRLGSGVASLDGKHLILTSPSAGATSRIVIRDAIGTRVRRFVTRAYITDDAASKILGFARSKAAGTNATPARLVSRLKLSRGVDLRTNRFLRIAVDSGDAKEVDCAAHARIPRAAMLDEIVAAINARFSTPIASADGGHLILTAPTAGSSSSIRLEPTLAMDAVASLLAPESGSATGRSANGIRFTGTVDLSGGADLRHGDTIKLGVDDAEPAEIPCAGPDPRLTTLDQIVESINWKFPGVALHDGKQIHLSTPSAGPESRLEFAVPAARDATWAIFGIAPPRIYRGDAPEHAVIVGSVDLCRGVDLSTPLFLGISINGAPPLEIDCGTAAADPRHARLPDIVNALNQAAGLVIAASDGVHLVLRSPGKGIHERIALSPSHHGDARASLFGQGPFEATGENAQPAVIRGRVDLQHSLNLAEGSTLRLTVDGRRPVDIDVAGAAPDRTSPQEIVDRIDSILPKTAALDEDRLILRSQTSGEHGTLEILPIRALELIDYPPVCVSEAPVELKLGNRFGIDNNGAADSVLEFDLSAPQGESGMEFVDPTAGTQVRIKTALASGGTLAIAPCGAIGIIAEVTGAGGITRRLPDSSVLSGMIGAQARVPFVGQWPLSRPGGPDKRPALQLNDPAAPAIVILRALSDLNAGEEIAVQVTEAHTAVGGSRILSLGRKYIHALGLLRRDAEGYRLVDESGTAILDFEGGLVPHPAISPDRLVAVSGPVRGSNEWPFTVAPERIMPLFDVRLRFTAPGAHSNIENYLGVSIGLGDTPVSLQVKVLERPSQLVRADEVSKAEPLRFPRGPMQLTYMNCHEARFDRVVFASESASAETSGGEVARFAGGRCHEWAVFDISRFSDARPDGDASLFGPPTPVPDPPVQVQVHWTRHQPGAFTVNLPADLDEAFGARFNGGRFGLASGSPEQYNGVITEPASDPDYIVKRINAKSTLVKASACPGPTSPPGFEAVTIPFLHPRSHKLTGGSVTEFARIFLAESGVSGLIELQAREKGPWGNTIAITARQAGPARFDVTVGYVGLHFENARQIALAGRILRPNEDPLSQVAAQILKPGTVGVLQAKAAGVRADVTRDRTATPPDQDSCRPSISGRTQSSRDHDFS
jgi:hypothetical protein